MDRDANKLTRLLKRLKAAVGYHELGMTTHALQCLNGLTGLGEIGPFGFVAEVLRDEFSRGWSDQLSAAAALEVAEGLAPRAVRRAIRMTLLTCFDNSRESESGRNSLPSVEAATR
jgi:hypothetical protein